MPAQLVFATHNTHKAKEIGAMFQGLVDIVSLKDLNWTEDIPETGSTLQENAAIKAHTIYTETALNCFADDTGLMVDALQGAPGVFSARYAGEPKDDEANIQKLLQELQGSENRQAKFVSVICLYRKGKPYFFEGELKGVITLEKTGTEGFGYDPVFMPEGESRTLAQMSLEEKNTISHRYRAFQKMLRWLEENPF